MSSIVVECSKFNETTPNSNNAEWANTFKHIIIEDGDIIQLKQVIIDTNTTQAGIMVFDKNVNIVMEFGFYAQNNGDTDKTFSTGYSYTFKPTIAFTNSSTTPATTVDVGVPHKNTLTFTILAGTYTCNDIAELITRNCSEFIPESYPLGNNGIDAGLPFLKGANKLALDPVFVEIDSEDTGVWDPAHYWHYETGKSYWYGASEVAMSYNAENDGRFRWDYLHMPIYSGAKPAVISIGYEVDSFATSWPITKTGGIFFTKLEPTSFWEGKLGFILEDILLKVDTTNKRLTTPADVHLSTAHSFDDVTTDALFTLSSCIDTQTGDWRKPPSSYLLQSTNTRPVNATNSVGESANNAGPFFLLEINTNYNLDYTYNNGNPKSHIQAIVSRQYDTNNYITGYSDSGVTYVHNGTPFLLSSTDIRILDPITKQTTSTLGPNSSVFLEIFKSPKKDSK